MDQPLKDRILSNKFLIKLRTEGVIDKDQHQDLCNSLRKLSSEWKNASLIDKEMAQELYTLTTVTLNEAMSQWKRNPKFAQELEDIWVELDALVMECLTDPLSLDVVEKRLKMWQTL